MEYRELGTTGVTVSEIGMGCGGLGGPGKEGLEGSLDYAFDQGVTLYDTADMYGYGESERVLGRVFAGRRDQVVFATKFGTVLEPGGAHKDVSLAHMREALDNSLRSLKTDYVDVYQLHNPPMEVVNDGELFGELDRLVTDGKIRAYGISVDDRKSALKFLDLTNGKVIQMFFNLLGQRARDPFMTEEVAAHGAGTIIKVPMAGGVLSGKCSADNPPPGDERRERWGEEEFMRRVKLAELVRPILEAPGRTMAQGALAWLLTFDSVSAVIPGVSSLDKVAENAGAGGMRLTGDEMAALDELAVVKDANLGW